MIDQHNSLRIKSFTMSGCANLCGCGILSIVVTLLLIAISCSGSSYEPGTPSSEKRLIKMLIENYEKVGKIGRPVRHTRETVVVGFGLSLFQLLDLDEKDQILTVNVWAKYTWIDQLLQWDPANYSNIREVRIPPEKIWTPDIVLYNFVDERLKELRNVLLNVDYLGRVFWSPPAIFKSSCRIDIRGFPFDYQFCYLRFASKTLFSDQMDLQFLDNRTEVDIDQYTSSNEWTLLARPAQRFVMMSKQCGKTIPDLTFFLFLKRNPAFYAYLLVFPCIMLSLIPTVTFWFPPHIPAKMLLGQNVFVAFSLLLKFLAKSTPSASLSVPYLGYFYSLNMISTSVSTFLSTVIINVHNYSQKRGDVPPCLVKMVQLFSYHEQLTNSEVDSSKTTFASLEREAKRKQRQAIVGAPSRNMLSSKSFHPACFGDPNIGQHYSNPPGVHSGNANITAEFPKTRQSQWGQHSPPESVVCRRGKAHKTVENDSELTETGQVSNRIVRYQPSARRATMQIHSSLASLRNSLKNLMEKIAKKEASAKRSRDWRLVVMTLDRMFFWTYLLIVIISGCYLLIPRAQTHSVEEVLKMHAEAYTRRNKEIAADCLLPKLQIPGYHKEA